jgi:hypothetical protein
MRRRLIALFALAFAAWAANVKLYLNDGTYQLVREYKVENDRVRFYSLDRADWEEIPKELVDFKRTETEAKQRQDQIDREAKVISEEEKVARDLEKEVMRIPQNPGVYWVEAGQVRALRAAESTIHTNKGRSVLKILTPIPVVSGHATLEIPGAHAERTILNPEQEFYIQLSETERFAIVRVTTKGQVRIVENLVQEAITKEMTEERDPVDIFQKQMTDGGLYKIWPKQPFAPGEYAVIEFTEGKMNMQIWDFAYRPGSETAPRAPRK